MAPAWLGPVYFGPFQCAEMLQFKIRGRPVAAFVRSVAFKKFLCPVSVFVPLPGAFFLRFVFLSKVTFPLKTSREPPNRSKISRHRPRRSAAAGFFEKSGNFKFSASNGRK